MTFLDSPPVLPSNPHKERRELPTGNVPIKK